MSLPVVVLRPGADRPRQGGGPGVLIRPGLAFGAHYDPERTAFGALVAHNVDDLAPGAAYGAHEHRDTEILTWVLTGTLVHVDPDGAEDHVRPGSLQYLATGTGWRHDERGGAGDTVRAVQMWLAPALDDPPPGPPERRVVVPPETGDVVLAGIDGLVRLCRSGVRVTLLRPAPGERRALEDGSYRHVHVVDGALEAPADPSATGSPPREGDRPLVATAGDTLEVSGRGAVELAGGPGGAVALVVTTT